MKDFNVQDFINGTVTYDPHGSQYFWINEPQGGVQMLAEMRGYGCLQNMAIKTGAKGEEIMNVANAMQDKIGNWVAEAINEKLAREKKGTMKVMEVGQLGMSDVRMMIEQLRNREQALLIIDNSMHVKGLASDTPVPMPTVPTSGIPILRQEVLGDLPDGKASRRDRRKKQRKKNKRR